MDSMLVINTLNEGMIIFSIGFVTFGAVIVGLFSKYKIFAVLACGGNITLIVEFQNYPALVIALIGSTIFMFYHAFWGGEY